MIRLPRVLEVKSASVHHRLHKNFTSSFDYERLDWKNHQKNGQGCRGLGIRLFSKWQWNRCRYRPFVEFFLSISQQESDQRLNQEECRLGHVRAPQPSKDHFINMYRIDFGALLQLHTHELKKLQVYKRGSCWREKSSVRKNPLTVVSQEKGR